MERPLEIVVASGKGGTGKTTVSAFLLSFFSLSNYDAIGVDADVEAPDLIIALGKYKEIGKEEVIDSPIATINYNRCVSCGECLNACQFGAIEWMSKPVIISELCEGCGVCEVVCRYGAVKYSYVKTGDIIIQDTKYGLVIMGQLEIGRKHSGKLVEMLKERARKYTKNNSIIIVDAAAGTGCPVISSIVGSDYLIIVVEPTRQSIRTASKVIEIGRHFKVKIGIVVNKWDLNPDFKAKIEAWADEKKVEVLGYIPYDKSVIEAYVNMSNLLDFAPKSKATEALINIYENLVDVLRREGYLK